jgi:hypothetical protein
LAECRRPGGQAKRNYDGEKGASAHVTSCIERAVNIA